MQRSCSWGAHGISFAAQLATPSLAFTAVCIAAFTLLLHHRATHLAQVTLRPELLQSLLQHVRPQLSLLTPGELVRLVWAVHRLQLAPPAAWMDALFAQSLALLPQLRGDEAAVLLRGLGGAYVSFVLPACWMAGLLLACSTAFLCCCSLAWRQAWTCSPAQCRVLRSSAV